jgi:hypothetical protein
MAQSLLLLALQWGSLAPAAAIGLEASLQRFNLVRLERHFTLGGPAQH